MGAELNVKREPVRKKPEASRKREASASEVNLEQQTEVAPVAATNGRHGCCRNFARIRNVSADNISESRQHSCWPTVAV